MGHPILINVKGITQGGSVEQMSSFRTIQYVECHQYYLPGNPKNDLVSLYTFHTLRYGTPESGGRTLPELPRSVAATTRATPPTLFSRIRFHLSRGLESCTALLR